ncbi:GNAT family N-acetyltransferase [Youngiibacter fragilis]|uniref:GNAT family acetyltransferase n=1 Tax=Youngiibacter fragilis 232.1 TaxID=994573 RepID=V7I2E6_9CLOT|nr:GNAT family N-acetyltransferase [Youngiibacter fragilis]ETA79172.1 GNAT family acetyltransferase [Youngiibacter fragilis 232.1]
MAVAEHVTKKDIEELEGELEGYRSFNKFNEDFLSIYRNSSMIVRHQMRSSSRVIWIDGVQVMFLWCDFRSYSSTIRTMVPLKALGPAMKGSSLQEIIPAVMRSASLSDTGRFRYNASESPENRQLLEEMGFYLDEMSLSMKIDTAGLPSMGTVPEVRQYRVEDIDDRVKVQNLIFEDRYRIPLGRADILIEMAKRTYIPDASWFLIKYGRIAGYGQIMKSGSRKVLVNFGVVPEMRGKGLSRDFLIWILEQGKAMGYKEIYLDVNAGNIPAVNLYQTTGFEIVEKKVKWYFKEY